MNRYVLLFAAMAITFGGGCASTDARNTAPMIVPPAGGGR